MRKLLRGALVLVTVAVMGWAASAFLKLTEEDTEALRSFLSAS